MKVVFLGTKFNHHQLSLSDALCERLGGAYCYVEHEGLTEERKQLGYIQHQRDYVLRCPEDEERIRQRIREADVVIAGSTSEKWVRQCIKTGKLVFRYSERPLKNGPELWKYLPRLVRWHLRNPMHKPIYMLCASAYAAGDYAKFGLFRNRTYKWGYFPEMKRYEEVEKLLAGKDSAEILWCGRFIDWKHPDDAIMAAKRLKEEGYGFRLNFIGRGEMEPQLRRMTKDLGLEDCVLFLGSMRPEEVREHMEHAGIYLFTSDRNEGWGAVLNESMNSGCAVVAGHAIGAVPFLLRDGENGLIYESENVDMLCEKIRSLLLHPQRQKELGMEAYKTITEHWNAEVAADRLLCLSDAIVHAQVHPGLFEEGLCSAAVPVKED